VCDLKKSFMCTGVTNWTVFSPYYKVEYYKM